MLEFFGEAGLGSLAQILRDASPVLVGLAAASTVLFLTFRILRGSPAGTESRGASGHFSAAVVSAFTTNWQLTLLAATAIVLSVASGWTTWDGMRNFTGEPVLSLLITFGIQGVMLIIAWLIGESFATGMNRRSRGRERTPNGGFWSHIEPFVGMVVGGLCAVGLLAILADALGAFDELRVVPADDRGLSAFADKALYIGVALLVVATLLINQRSDIVQPYLQSARVIARNAILWVMFLACMATSVFFSFDSLFSTIFPQDERKRSADIRAQRQVAGAVTDIGILARRRHAEEAEQLFRSGGWTAFESNLTALSRASLGAEQAIEGYFVERMEAHKSSMAAQQQRIAAARGGQAGLSTRKAVLTDEMTRLTGERPGLAADLADKKTELDTRNRNIDAKRVEAMAEERGAEGTLKIGKGPAYRLRMAELAQMQDAIRIQEQRVRDAEKRLAGVDARTSQIGRELAAIDADLAKLKGEAETAEQRIQVAEANNSTDGEMPKVDPARVRGAFERAHAEFRQKPTADRLTVLAEQCTQLLDAMAATPATKERVRNVDCDPKPAVEAASTVFALERGTTVFAEACVGGDKLPAGGGTDAMLAFGRKCLQDAGLPNVDSAAMAARISAIDLNRDDKANRFVVTWNAFTDGNRLAYLALAIAIAIDALVFLSGVFGANAVRSPLTDLEGREDLSADQLEATIDATLRHTSDPRGTLSALLRAMHPVHASDGYTAEIELDEHEPHVDEMRAVLVAGVTIGAVRRAGAERGRYLVSTGLARYFAMAQRKAWKVKTVEVERKELVNVIGVALLPDPGHNADLVLSEMHPISDSQGFAAEAYPYRIADEAKRRLVTNTLGAGATVQGAVRRIDADGRYFVSTDFYKTLLLMRAGAIPAFRPDVVRARYALPSPGGGGGHAQGTHHHAPPPLHVEPIPRIEDHTRDTAASDETASSMTPPAQPSDRRRPGPQSVDTSMRQGESPRPPSSEAPPLAKGVMPARSTIDHEASLSEEIRANIIHLGGLYAWSEAQIAVCRAIGPGSEAELALKRLNGRAPRLASLVGETIDENRASVRDAYEYLLSHNGDEPMYRQVLETVASELDELMPILMLTPGGPYQQLLENVLVYSLERQAGEGVLSPAEDALLARAKRQVEALKAMSDNAADRLARIVRIIDQYDERFSEGSVPFEKASAAARRANG
jgi:hypothetical protein